MFVTVMLTVAFVLFVTPSLTRNVKLSLPCQFAPGVYVTFGAVPLNDPWLGPLTTSYVSVCPSSSLPVSVIAFARSSPVVTLCPLATGTWLVEPPPVLPAGLCIWMPLTKKE